MKIFVTGGSQGIGLAITEEALTKGHQVFFTYFENTQDAEQLCKRFPSERLMAAHLDVKNSSDVDKVVEKAIAHFGSIDAVVNNAGIADSTLAVNVSDEEWDRVLKTNLYGSFYVSRAFLPHFTENRAGSFVHIGSIDQNGARGNISYSASKAGLIGLSGSLAKEYGRLGIRSNLVVPGFVDTKMIHGKVHSKILEKYFNEYSLTGQYIQPAEVARFVVFLCSEDSSAINGAELPITAGLAWRP